MRFESHAALHASGAIHRADNSLQICQLNTSFLISTPAGVGMAPGTYASVVQRSEHRLPKPGTRVRLPSGAPTKMQNAECRMQNEYAESMRSKRRTRGTTAAPAWAARCRPSAPPTLAVGLFHNPDSRERPATRSSSQLGARQAAMPQMRRFESGLSHQPRQGLPHLGAGVAALLPFLKGKI